MDLVVYTTPTSPPSKLLHLQMKGHLFLNNRILCIMWMSPTRYDKINLLLKISNGLFNWKYLSRTFTILIIYLTVWQRIDRKGESTISIIRGSPINVLIVLIVIGLLLVPVISAGSFFQSYQSYFSTPKDDIYTGQLNSGQIPYSLHIRAGSHKYDITPFNGDSRTGPLKDQFDILLPFPAGSKDSVPADLTYNENSTVCGSCGATADRSHLIPYSPGKVLIWIVMTKIKLGVGLGVEVKSIRHGRFY